MTESDADNLADLADGLWSVEHAARFVDVSPYLIRRWLRDGRLAPYNVGTGRRKVRVSKKELMRLLASLRELPTTVPSRPRRKPRPYVPRYL